ncbi:MAG: hypothetical protein HY880_03800 [Deltaproteobacteria bacterium]|nr:hypothetical protein [Deltaproteobacteria bacterium]
MPPKDDTAPLHLKAIKEDSVAISDEGRRRIMEKFKNDVLEQLTKK